MGIFSRIREIVSSNVNSALERMEDPAKMIALMIRELQETESSARASLAQRKGEIASLQREIADRTASAARWEARATLAVESEKEELAREALFAKHQELSRIEQIEAQIGVLEESVAAQMTQLLQISDKLAEVKQKQQLLVDRAKSAKERRAVAQTLKKSDSSEIAAKFSELESKIERLEAEAELESTSSRTDLDAFIRLEADAEIEAELARLKEAQAKPKSAPKKSAAEEKKS
ncbi:MAG TPA: PspA/IM30 family protein [Sphaerochaeta sp.]|nr:PspA/IM30 family protein [Sphaerochaeta sp.]